MFSDDIELVLETKANLDVVLIVFQWAHVINNVISVHEDVTNDYGRAVLSVVKTVVKNRHVA